MRLEQPPAAAAFPTTQWSLVGQAGSLDPEQRRQALGELLARYTPAMLSVLRFEGVPAGEAEDLLQGFVCDRVIQNNILGAADRSRGRFRSFIFASLRNYALNRRREQLAAKRCAARPVVALDADGAVDAPAPEAAVDAFDTEWLRQVLQQTLERMHRQCQMSAGAERVWRVFRERVLDPARRGEPPPRYEDLASALGVDSAAQAANLLVTAKRMFARILRSVVAEYTRDEAEMEDELRWLKALVG
jgi:DNA-directed RNA polymerase specialized sigma24 family protein